MRLLTKVSVYYALVSLCVFALGGYTFYRAFSKEVYEELDEQLRDEKRNIERMLGSSDSIPSFYPGVNITISITPAPARMKIKLERKDTIVNHPYEGRIPFRQWRFTVKAHERNYYVVLRKSLIDLQDLSEEIIRAMLYSFLALMVCSILLNYIVLRRTFRPFYTALAQLRRYSLDNASRLQLSSTSTREFSELNETLRIMSTRIQEDYNNIKEFTENASHEIQTPLAIIKHKLELLMQHEQLDSGQAALIQSAFQAADRLSRLNSSLILLTRISNREFSANETIDLGAIAKTLAEQMREQFVLKELRLSINETGAFVHPFNRTLAEVLVSNLFTNAVRHTDAGGEIVVDITPGAFSISNSGKPLAVSPQKLFVRFFRSGSSSESMGIGLAIVKRIAEAHKLKVSYAYNEKHVITLTR